MLSIQSVHAVGVVVLGLLATFLYRGYQARARVRRINKLPGHSWIWGHLKVMGEVQATMPKNIPPGHVLYEVARKHGLDDDFYVLDAWPFNEPVLVSSCPEISDQFTVHRSMPKFKDLEFYIEPVTGKQNLVVDSGPRWKKWRSAFNPGFSNAHLMTLLPDIVNAIEILKQNLSAQAQKDEPFRMERLVNRMTIDVIGKLVLDVDLNSQRVEHPVVQAFEQSCLWLPIGVLYQPSEIWDIRRPYIFWKNTRTMNKFIDKTLVHRWATRGERKKSKYIIDLALETYLKESGTKAGDVSELDREFRKAALEQVKTFIFAGHETTASTISYCIYYLANYPEILAKARAEIDTVFGKGSDVGQRIKDDPTLINKTYYLMAITKEALRKHSPANSSRWGAKDFFINDPRTGLAHSTEEMGLVALVSGNHYNKRWGDPFEFRPERWLEGKVPEGSWIPFSKSPRNCIGQELALIEVRMALAMLLPDFDFRSVYDELEALKDDDTNYTSDTIGEKGMWNQEAYQMYTTAKPREGMPLRVYERKI